ncbi:cell envelope integrity protein TolA [Desulfobacterales bacterium HSG17]|nr:cell envelope integrity protein TolA [Desulfobacterales bacterium HSG17]
MVSDISLPYRAEIDNRLMAGFLFISILCHLVFMGLILIIPAQTSQKPLMPSVISVNMVSLPTQEEAGGPEELINEPEETPLITAESTEVQAAEPEQLPVLAEEPDIEPETLAESLPPEPIPSEPFPMTSPEQKPDIQPELQAEQQPENIPDSKDKVVIKEAPEEKPKEQIVVKSENTAENEKLPEKTPEKIIVSKRKNPQTRKPDKIKNQKIKNQIVKPEDIKSESIKDAINRVRKKLAKQNTGKSAAAKGSTAGGVSGGPINDIYKAQIAYQIEGNWAFSEQLLKKHSDLQTLVAVKVLPSGHIEDIWFQKRSGDTYLDDSAYRAVMKSNPFPPLPRGYSESHTFILRFTPSGLN